MSDLATIGTINRLIALFRPAPPSHAISVDGCDAVAATTPDAVGASWRSM